MELMIAAALKQVGEEFPFDLTQPIDSQEYGGRMLGFAAPLHVSGRYVFDGKAFTVSGTAETVLRSTCARCAEPFDEPFSFAFSERFSKQADASSDEEVYPYEGERLSLDTAVMDNLYLSLPLTSVCRSDCLGLCPVCGVNRNETPCDCEARAAKNAFSVLQGMDFEDSKD